MRSSIVKKILASQSIVSEFKLYCKTNNHDFFIFLFIPSSFVIYIISNYAIYLAMDMNLLRGGIWEKGS